MGTNDGKEKERRKRRGGVMMMVMIDINKGTLILGGTFKKCFTNG